MRISPLAKSLVPPNPVICSLNACDHNPAPSLQQVPVPKNPLEIRNHHHVFSSVIPAQGSNPWSQFQPSSPGAAMRTIRRHLVLVLTLCLGALTASAQQPEDFATLQKRAAAGDAAAQNNLGDRYYYGNGVSVDYAQSLAWYRKAADQGNAAGQANLAYMYSHGRGVSEDDAQAFAWYHKAADQGYAVAQNNLGSMYQNGKGVPQDYAQALTWYRKAADQGSADAQNNLGDMYYYGHGVSPDDAQSRAWYRKAADQGNAAGQANLAYMYSHGPGVTEDDARASSAPTGATLAEVTSPGEQSDTPPKEGANPLQPILLVLPGIDRLSAWHSPKVARPDARDSPPRRLISPPEPIPAECPPPRLDLDNKASANSIRGRESRAPPWRSAPYEND